MKGEAFVLKLNKKKLKGIRMIWKRKRGKIEEEEEEEEIEVKGKGKKCVRKAMGEALMQWGIERTTIIIIIMIIWSIKLGHFVNAVVLTHYNRISPSLSLPTYLPLLPLYSLLFTLSPSTTLSNQIILFLFLCFLSPFPLYLYSK